MPTGKMPASKSRKAQRAEASRRCAEATRQDAEEARQSAEVTRRHGSVALETEIQCMVSMGHLDVLVVVCTC